MQVELFHLFNYVVLNNASFTEGWLNRWKSRHSITFKKEQGEKAAADTSGAEVWKAEMLPAILEKYGPENTFNADETGLYWKGFPGKFCVYNHT